MFQNGIITRCGKGRLPYSGLSFVNKTSCSHLLAQLALDCLDTCMPRPCVPRQLCSWHSALQDGEDEASVLVSCDMCGVTVHTTCYGLGHASRCGSIEPAVGGGEERAVGVWGKVGELKRKGGSGERKANSEQEIGVENCELWRKGGSGACNPNLNQLKF